MTDEGLKDEGVKGGSSFIAGFEHGETVEIFGGVR